MTLPLLRPAILVALIFRTMDALRSSTSSLSCSAAAQTP